MWLNSEPRTAAALRGRVVVVQFWTYSCVNWLRTLPYIRAWHERYREVVFIGVHAPEFGFEHDLANVRHAVRELGIEYPVVIDNEFRIWRGFDNHYWPALYLLDGDGRVAYQHFGEEAYVETERAIQALLRHRRGRLSAVDAVRPRGAGRLGRAALAGDLSRRAWRGRTAGELALNDWSLAGEWSVDDEFARLDSASGRSPFASRRATSTWCSPARRGFTCASTASPRATHHGLDVDASGAGMLSEPRMYQLIRQAELRRANGRDHLRHARRARVRLHLRLISRRAPRERPIIFTVRLVVPCLCAVFALGCGSSKPLRVAPNDPRLRFEGHWDAHARGRPRRSTPGRGCSCASPARTSARPSTRRASRTRRTCTSPSTAGRCACTGSGRRRSTSPLPASATAGTRRCSRSRRSTTAPTAGSRRLPRR